MTPDLNEHQLDALGELANIGAGTAATALAQMIGQDIDLQVPRAQTMPIEAAIAAAGPADLPVTGVAIGIEQDLDALVLLLIPDADAHTLCGLLGVEAFTEVGESALREIGNILGASYMNALATITGLSLDLRPPELSHGRLADTVSALLRHTSGKAELALTLDTSLDLVAGACSVKFLLLPVGSSAVHTLLAPLGLGT